ncbi:MAG: acyltransferase family protein [Bacilli bacterium]|nr:acyltransferase family protein [Bacilli bacterium]
MNKTRSSNFELMRIISMFFIILWHILMHGNVLENADNKALVNFLSIIMFIIIVHVNSYVIVFGYFQSKSKFKLSKLLKLFLQVVFYSFLILLIAIKMKWITDYSIVNFIENIIPSCFANYWFIHSYIIVYIFSDYLNMFIERLSRKEYKNLLIVLFVMLSIVPYVTGYRILGNDGYNYTNFIFLYFIGGYLRRYPIKESYHLKNMSLNGYRMFLIFIFLTMAISNYLINYYARSIYDLSNVSTFISSRLSISTTSYSCPFVIIQTIAFFELFKSINIKSKLINILSANVFGIYLVHDHVYIRENIYKILKIDNGYFYGYRHIIYIIFGMILIFIIGWIIEYLRKIIMKLIYKIPLVQKLINQMHQFICSFNFRINI